MNPEIAKFLLESLIERIDRNAIGTVSSAERQALGVALAVLRGGTASPSATPVETPTPPSVAGRVADAPPTTAEQVIPVPPPQEDVPPPEVPKTVQPKVVLVTDALDRSTPDDPNVLLCLDFGTAMSKAFAQSDDGQPFELELGAQAGGEGYAVPSSVFITDGGKVLFGFEAVDASQELSDSTGRAWIRSRAG